MLATYRSLFATARTRRLVGASLLGRLAVGGMLDLPLILAAQDASGSYAVGGAALGAHAAGVAVSAPLRGRLVDRRGARAALPPFVLVTAMAIACLPLVADVGADWPIVALAAVAGLGVPALVPSMRVEWQRLLGREDARLAQAYTFESVAQVALFIVGPLLAGAGIAVVGTSATLVGTGALALVGGMAFALQAGGAAQGPIHAHRVPRPIRLPGLRILVLTTAFADAGLGAVDVAVVAFAEQRGEAGAAGVLLALFAASSVLGGTIYGARAWTSAPARRLALLTGFGALALLPLGLADSLLALGCLLVLARGALHRSVGGKVARSGQGHATPQCGRVLQLALHRQRRRHRARGSARGNGDRALGHIGCVSRRRRRGRTRGNTHRRGPAQLVRRAPASGRAHCIIFDLSLIAQRSSAAPRAIPPRPRGEPWGSAMNTPGNIRRAPVCGASAG